jgi:pectin methylesterase-like acyl-CoA thioesterase
MTDNGDKTYTYTVTDDVTRIDIVNAAQVYLSHVAVTLPKVEQGGDEPVTSEEIKATWDYSNADVMSETVALSGTSTAGEVNSVEKTLKMTVEANGASFRSNGNNIQVRSGAIFKVPVRTVGDEVTVKGYPNYAQYTVGNVTVNSTGGNGATPDATYKAKVSDVENGYVAITSTNNNNYYYSISVTQYAVTGPTTLDGEEATTTFPFNLGTAGQTATFSEGDADYFLNSKVELGANMGYAATRTLGDYTFTKIQPQTANASAAAEDYVLFRIQPKPGFTFTPSAASLVAYKDGTGNGTLTIAFVTADGTETTLATDQAIARNSETPAYTSLAYNDLSAVTPVEGVVGLKVYIGGNLATNKQVGLSNIIIEGTLSGTEKDLPILASFKANGTEYTVDEVFGDLYEADLELSKSESMISESNPLTEITATSGEVGTVTYTDATETGCKVTIPVTAGETTLEYILNITQKPDFTLTYIGVDGTTVLKTQTVEKDATIGTFAQDIADVTASKDGYKARGWFKNNYVGEKWATTDVVTADANLYAVETEIEVASLSKKYVFDLTDKNFDPADHEAFNPTGGKPNVSDMRHGWAFANGNTIDLLVGPKASIIISTCQYPTNGTTKITASNGQSIDAVSATDGATATIEYDGEPGTLTLSFDGTAYIHKLTILNTAETNYEKDGNWIIAKAGDASSFLDALDAANGTSGEDPVYIFLPNGTYDLAQTTKTNIGRSNVSIIGESMEGVIIKNRPVKEGIDITATLFNTSENLYMQDLTLDCVAPYGTGDDTSSAERGVTLHDKGTKTICKNVYLKGLQDTYYCNNNDGQYYFEDGKIEGTVDYICGHGDAYFNKVALFNAKRTNGNSGDVIAAPNTPKLYGYIFNECTIDGVDGQDGQYALGRPWASNTQVIFLNTTMKIQPKAEGWSEWSNDVAKQNSVKQFAEYNSVDANGNAIDLTGRKKTFKGVTNVPTLNKTQAGAFALETVFAGWNPAQYTKQVKTTQAKFDGNTKTLTWSAVDGATMYAIVKNGSIIDLTDQTSYTIADETQGAKGLGTATEDPTAAGDTYAVRAANSRGGFGEAVVADDVTGIDNITTDATGINGTITEVYSMGGARLAAPQKGVNIVKVKANDGSVKTVKVVIK